MMWMRFNFPWLIVSVALVFLFSRSGLAQIGDPRCPVVVETALTQLGSNCAGLGTNAACYGFTRVDATFVDQALASSFSRPTDRTDLANLLSIRTTTADPQLDQWGIAVMNVQADIPDTLPGQNVTFLLLGETEVENAAQPDDVTLKPMQAFYFRSGLGAPTCGEAPSLLAVRSPENIKVNLTANGADFQLGSVVMLRVLPPGNVMELATIEGSAILGAGTPDQIIVPGGFSSNRCLSLPGSLGADGTDNDQEVYDTCPWTPPRPFTPQQSQLALYVDQAFQALDGNYTPMTQPEQVPPTNVSSECPGGSVVHVVSARENLFRIALRYQTSMQSIAQANGIRDLNVLFSGQQLVIPCVGSGFVNIPIQPIIIPPVITPGAPPPIIDCTGFRATSPLDGFPYGPVTFYWDPAPVASSYIVTVYNSNGARVASFSSNATNASGDASTFGDGTQFSWEVTALLNGGPVCSSGRVTVNRESPDLDRDGDGGLWCPATSAC